MVASPPLLFLVFVGIAFISAQDDERTRGFVLTAPKHLMAETVEQICLFFHNVTSDGEIWLQLLSTNASIISTASQKIDQGKSQCIEMFIPGPYTGKAELSIRGVFPAKSGSLPYIIHQSKPVIIKQHNSLVFIQSDKPIYKPGEKVRFRILHINAEMKPITNEIPLIWIEDPTGIRIAQWLKEKPQEGLVDLEMKLSSEPKLGKWSIKTDLGKFQKTLVFEVEEYVLPKFEVKIHPPPFIVANQHSASWNVCAYYSYGKPVRGTAVIKVVLGEIRYSRKTLVHYEGIIEGCHSVTGEVRNKLRRFDPFQTEVHATVTEKGTNETMIATATSEILLQSILLDMNSYMPAYYKPGLPFYGKIKVTSPDKKPVANMSVEISINGVTKARFIETLAMQVFKSNDTGYISFTMMSPFLNDIEKIYIKARILAVTAHSFPLRYRPLHHSHNENDFGPHSSFSVPIWHSPSNNFLQIQKPPYDLPCDGEYPFTVFYTESNKIIQLTYLIISRGNILHQSSHLQELKENKLNLNNSWYLQSGQEDYFNFFTITVPLLLKMAPISRLLVFYIQSDGEIIADSLEFGLQKCTENNVKLNFQPRHVIPAAHVEVSMTAFPHSLCALGVVDKAVHFLRSTNQITLAKVFNALSIFDITKNSMPKQSEDKQCSLHSEIGDHHHYPFLIPKVDSDFVDAATAFDDIGVIVISDLTYATVPCNDYMDESSLDFYISPRSLFNRVELTDAPVQIRNDAKVYRRPKAELLDDVVEKKIKKSAVEIRNFFPETWLWDLHKMGSSGTKNIPLQVPHSITHWVGNAFCISSYSGIGIADPAHLKAFQPFFLTYTLPYSVKRGETIPLLVSTSNYLQECLPIKVTLQEGKFFSIASGNVFKKVCLCKEETKTIEFMIRPKTIGTINITVYAYTSTKNICDNYTSDPISNEQARDAITKSLLVEAEGFPKEIVWTSLICLNESDDSRESKDFMKGSVQLSLPEGHTVPESEKAYITVIGDTMGPTLQGLDHLVRLPVGCGEQNMVLFAPNIYVLTYLQNTNQLTAVMEKTIISHLKTGYQRELSYRHNDGSFSAFGENDREGSIWLTAFVLKCFAEAREYIFIDESIMNTSISWITDNQMENGCYSFVGKVLHKAMKGGIDDSESSFAALTAYITIALLEAGLSNDSSSIINAFYCLKAEKEPDLYTLAISTYAAILAKDEEYSSYLLKRLMGLSFSTENLLYWGNPSKSSTALNVEISSYALLSLVSVGDEKHLLDAQKVFRWITQQRNSQGGFISTQDTIVALQALSKFASKFQDMDVDLEISVESNQFHHVFRINNENKLVQQTIDIPVLPTVMDFTATGKGYSVLQTVLKYNLQHTEGSDAFTLETRTENFGTTSASCKRNRLEICARYLLNDEVSNMVVIEIKMVSGFEPDKKSLAELLDKKEIKLKRWDANDDQINLYFDEVTSQEKCFSTIIEEIIEVKDAKPAIVKIYDYYQPELFVRKSYSVKGCNIETLPLAAIDDDLQDK